MVNAVLMVSAKITVPIWRLLIVTVTYGFSITIMTNSNHLRCPQQIAPCQPSARSVQICKTFSAFLTFHLRSFHLRPWPEPKLRPSFGLYYTFSATSIFTYNSCVPSSSFSSSSFANVQP